MLAITCEHKLTICSCKHVITNTSDELVLCLPVSLRLRACACNEQVMRACDHKYDYELMNVQAHTSSYKRTIVITSKCKLVTSTHELTQARNEHVMKITFS